MAPATFFGRCVPGIRASRIFFFQAEDGIRDVAVTGVQTCALPIFPSAQRATILSLDSMFGNLGGVIGQSGWGWVARMRSIGVAWAYSGATLLLGLPLYWLARRGAAREGVVTLRPASGRPASRSGWPPRA